ncbi:RDD family protein [Pedobacter agri]|uniref:RDD family protein n=1 Tax=Pedobacter agri TaxID=454586 RepID=UPI00292D3283|nr:RDD family protein [Pedobacter agri]
MNFDTQNPYDKVDYRYCRASSGLRLANYIIDSVVTYLLLVILVIIVALIDPEIVDYLDNGIISRIVAMVFYGIMMAFTEAMLNGKSIGKFITKTKAVNIDGTDISFEKSFTRNLIRVIPFNAFSALGTPSTPWHDVWSDTMVVEEKKVALQQESANLFTAVKKFE